MNIKQHPKQFIESQAEQLRDVVQDFVALVTIEQVNPTEHMRELLRRAKQLLSATTGDKL